MFSQVITKITPRNFKGFSLSIMLPFSCNEDDFKGIFSWFVSLWNNIYFFCTFRDSLFARNQSLIWLSSWFAFSNRTVILLSEENRFVSSAKSTGSRTLVELLRSFTKIRKSKDPSIEPWGTPHLAIFIPVLELLYEINCFLFDK